MTKPPTTPPVASPEKHAEGWSWWCPTCKKKVANDMVTYECYHDQRYGGCGEEVQEVEDIHLPVASPAFESADIKTVLRALKWMRIYEEANAVFGDDVVGKAEAALTRLSARQAAFEAMREALEWYAEDTTTVDDGEMAKAALALAEAEMKGEG